MTWCRLTRSARKLHVVCAVMLLVAGWLVMPPAKAVNLRELDPLTLRPPSGQTGLHFGFSLSHYTNNSERWLLVGAPRSNASNPEVPHPGALYKCQLNQPAVDRECVKVEVDLSNKDFEYNWAKGNNSEQGLGFSLASDGKAIVVCAPQWFAARKKYNEWNYLPAGMCFAVKSPGYEFKGFSPPFYNQTVMSMHYLSTGYCQFGISVAHVKGQNTFAFGAPGCWNWRGDTWEAGLGSEPDVQLDSPRLIGKFPQIDAGNNNWQSEGRYLGYSVASLRFGNKNAIVSSIPRNSGRDGSINTLDPTILILIPDPTNDSQLLKVGNISPSKGTSDSIRFAFFGYSLAALDVNGDGLEDLVVGAPLYSSPDISDQGAVFVYMQTASEDPTNGKTYQMKEEANAPQRVGKGLFSRFGSCMAAVGDLNGDGYEDLAVGAPFMMGSGGDSDRSGAVYVYMGAQAGLEKVPRQIIRAAAGQVGFGASIAQQLPSTEGEGFDVAVGAYNSDVVLVFRSQEVVDVTWDLTFLEKIDLNENKCICTNYESLCPCADMQFCLKYKKKVVKNRNDKRMGFVVILTAEDDEISINGKITEAQHSFEVQEEENYCKKFTVIAKQDIKEIKAFIIKGHVKLDEKEKNVILDYHSTQNKSELLPIRIHCSSGEISGCQSDITLEHKILSSYELMGTQPMKIQFKVRNQGEAAYESTLTVRSSDIFNPLGTEGDAITCDRNAQKEIECQLGKLSNNSEVKFDLSLKPSAEFFSSLDTHAAVFNMTAEVKTMSALSNPDAAINRIEAPIVIKGSLQLTRQSSQPSIVFFNSSSYYKSPSEAQHEDELGPEIKHGYNISNENDYTIYEAKLIIYWPHTIDGKHFLYLMENLSFSGMSHNCQYPSGVVDPFSLKDATTQGRQSHQRPSVHSIGDKSPEHKIITCSLGEISSKEQIAVSLRSRIVLRTLVELEVGTAVKNASSFVELQIIRMPLGYRPPEPSKSSVSTAISYQRATPEATIPVWLYIVSALGGLGLLGIIIAIMWKCGFFKRQQMKVPDNANADQEEHLAKEGEEEEGAEHDDVKTPTSPMLKETEAAFEDFEFHRG